MWSSLSSLLLSVSVVNTLPVENYVDWRTFHATGTNLGGWLVQEANINPQWWSANGGTPEMDEWTWCQNLGDRCGPVLEEHYATYITPEFIDKLANVGTTIIRIPTTYAAWIEVPGSQLYSGKQIEHLKRIATYAIEEYHMHVIIDMHSVPGGCNGLTIGEATGHNDWWNSTYNLDLSFQAIESIIDYIQTSGYPSHYTLEPINEPQDNLTGLFSPYALTSAGKAWLVQYYEGVLDRVTAVNAKIPVMPQIFPWDVEWVNAIDENSNVVLDMHHYYFPITTVSSANVSLAFCADAVSDTATSKFPVFFGEWSIQAGGNNSFADRERNVQAAQYAYNRYGQGSAMWNGRHFGNDTVLGQGTLADYWSYETFMNLGYVKPVDQLPSSLCGL